MGLRARAAGLVQYRLVLVALSLTVTVLAGLAVSAEHSAAQTADRATVFVVDTSTSMRGARLTAAKNALQGAASAIPAGAQVGLRSFSGSCDNGGIARVALGPFDEATFSAAVQNLSIGPAGTPTPAALRAAAATLPAAGERTLILISDGKTRCGDPCVVAAELASQLGPGFRIDTVGFNAPETAEVELACIANATGGTYVSVNDSAGLAKTLALSTARVTGEDPAAVGGATAGTGAAGAAAARVTALSLSRARFPAAATGTSISKLTARKFGTRVLYTISRRARVRFTVERVTTGRRVGGKCRILVPANRRASRCSRIVKLPGSFVQVGDQGRNSVGFTGRLRAKKLPSGLYNLVATALDAAGRTSAAKRVRFRIVEA